MRHHSLSAYYSLSSRRAAYGALDATTQSVISAFVSNIGGSARFNILTTYSDAAGAVTNAASLGASWVAVANPTTSVAESAISAAVSATIVSGALPVDASGLYLVVLARNTVIPAGCCASYCGWHDHMAYGAVTLKFGVICNPGYCDAHGSAGACGMSAGTSPNAPTDSTASTYAGAREGDAMVSVIAHELEEAVTDPLGNAWYDSAGSECGDKWCVRVWLWQRYVARAQ